MWNHIKILAVFAAVMTTDVSIMIPSLHDGLSAVELMVITVVSFAGVVGMAALMSRGDCSRGGED